MKEERHWARRFITSQLSEFRGSSLVAEVLGTDNISNIVPLRAEVEPVALDHKGVVEDDCVEATREAHERLQHGSRSCFSPLHANSTASLLRKCMEGVSPRDKPSEHSATSTAAALSCQEQMITCSSTCDSRRRHCRPCRQKCDATFCCWILLFHWLRAQATLPKGSCMST